MPKKRRPAIVSFGQEFLEEDKSVRMYMDLLAELPIGVAVLYVKDPKDLTSWRIEEMNPAALRMTEATDADAQRALVKFVPGIVETEMPWGVREVLRTGEEQTIPEYASRRVAGKIFNLKLFPLGGRYVGLTFDDITVRKATQEALVHSEEQMRLMIESVVDYAIFRMDSLGRVVSWNFGAQRITGYAADKIVGRGCGMLFHEKGADARFQEMLSRAEREGRAEIEAWYRRAEGTRFLAHSIITAIRDEEGALNGFVKVMRDVTAQRRIEGALAQRTADLARSNADLAQFAAIASHDLQAPLRKTRAFAEEIRERLGGLLDETGLDLLGRFLRALDSMQELIDGLLSLARVSAGSAPRERVNLSRLAAEAREELEPALSRDGGSVEIGPLPEIDADPRLIRQLLRNLLGNAVKFKKPGVPARVRISGVTRPDGGREVIVEDQGVGFDMSEAALLFQPFQRLHGGGEFPGHGLGLAICQRIAVRHGGSIDVESAVGRGTRMRVTFPPDGEADYGRTSEGPADRRRSRLRPFDEPLHR